MDRVELIGNLLGKMRGPYRVESVLGDGAAGEESSRFHRPKSPAVSEAPRIPSGSG